MSETRIKLGANFDPRMIRDDQWVFRGFSPDGTSKLWTYTDPVLDITIEKKEPVAADEFVRMNQEKLKDNEGKRWGDGKVISRIPLNVFFKEFKGRHDDPEFNDWFHNRPENQVWRVFKGDV
jgi:hypothetical protein